MATKTAKKVKSKPAAKPPKAAKPAAPNLDPAQEERSRAKPKALPPATEEHVREVYERGGALSGEIADLETKHQDLKARLKVVTDTIDAKTNELRSLWADARTGQQRLPLKAEGAAPAGPAAGKAEAQAYEATHKGFSLRVECTGPGEWSGTVTEGVTGVRQTISAQRTAGEAQQKCQALASGGAPLDWKPAKVKEASEDDGLDVVYVAFDGDLRLEAKQTSKGRWGVRDNRGRPLASDLPLAKAQKAAGEEIHAKKLVWARIEQPAAAPEAKKAEAPAA